MSIAMQNKIEAIEIMIEALQARLVNTEHALEGALELIQFIQQENRAAEPKKGKK